MNVSSLMATHDRFLGVQQSPPLAALYHMMETKIPRGPSPPAAALPPPPPPPRTSSVHARSYQHHHSPSSSSSSSTPHRIHNILGRASSCLQLSPDVAAGFAAAAAAAAAGLVVDPGVCPGYSVVHPPRPACNAGRTPCGPATSSSFWSHQAAVKSTVSPVTDWSHPVNGAFYPLTLGNCTTKGTKNNNGITECDQRKCMAADSEANRYAIFHIHNPHFYTQTKS